MAIMPTTNKGVLLEMSSVVYFDSQVCFVLLDTVHYFGQTHLFAMCILYVFLRNTTPDQVDKGYCVKTSRSRAVVSHYIPQQCYHLRNFVEVLTDLIFFFLNISARIIGSFRLERTLKKPSTSKPTTKPCP